MSRVLLVDDDPSVRGAVREILGAAPGYEIVGEASTVGAAKEKLALRPELILLDLGLPDGEGTEVLAASRALVPPPLVVILTIFDDDDHVFDALRGGAIGYVLKSDLASRLGAGLEEVAAGGSPMSPSIARRVLASFSPPPPKKSPDSLLTDREIQVTDLLAHGCTYDEIGKMLAVSTNTVRSFIRSIYEKLQVGSKTEAVREAMRLGIIDKP